MKHPSISIITVNYQGTNETDELLACLVKCHYPSFDVWVVDNGSKEPPFSLQKKYPNFNFIFSEKNLGFAGGNNLAISACNGDLILLLNNDTLVAPNFLDALPPLFAQNERIGIVSSRLMYYEQPGTVQFAGSKGMNPYTGRSFAIGWKQKDKSAFHENYPSSHAHGAAMCVKREVFEKIGLMWESYFLYYEELDFCERAKRAGFEIWYCGGSEVTHKESMSTGKDSPLKTYYLNRNRLLFIRRNLAGVQRISAILFFFLLAVPKNLLTLLLKGDFSRARNILRGLGWNLSHLKLPENSKLL